MLAALAFWCAAEGVGFAQTADEVAKAKVEIWAKEMAIYAGRAEGSVDYYLKNTSPNYLAWVYGTPKPFGRDALAANGKNMASQNHEKIDTQFSDFSLHGDTAIIYYINHRTVKPDGTPVDQVFDNIHVWVRENGDWKVLASMSRLEAPAK
jgi:ketosteroid isomerase-like protein